MIRGVVNARREAVVLLRLRGPTGTERGVDAVVDSGCTASLVLPAAVVAALGLVRQSAGARWVRLHHSQARQALDWARKPRRPLSRSSRPAVAASYRLAKMACRYSRSTG